MTDFWKKELKNWRRLNLYEAEFFRFQTGASFQHFRNNELKL